MIVVELRLEVGEQVDSHFLVLTQGKYLSSEKKVSKPMSKKYLYDPERT